MPDGCRTACNVSALHRGQIIRNPLFCLFGVPIGYIQSYVAAEAGDGWWPDEHDPGVRGIDQFLADGDRLDQGLGSQMVRQFAQFLFKDPTVTKIQTDPKPGNQRAIRCYEKAGFQRIGVVATPDGPALLMAIERHDYESNEGDTPTLEVTKGER